MFYILLYHLLWRRSIFRLRTLFIHLVAMDGVAAVGFGGVVLQTEMGIDRAQSTSNYQNKLDSLWINVQLRNESMGKCACFSHKNYV